MIAVLAAKDGVAQTEIVLHNFNTVHDPTGGTMPEGGVIFDGAGNLYGTTYGTGNFTGGTVFELTPKSGGGWTEKVLHNFSHNGRDGLYPTGNLIMDSSGNIYGTTSEGGASGLYGAVFKLTPTANGGWTEKIVHSFVPTNDGLFPTGGVVMDAEGNLYGTTTEGGTSARGTVFELVRTANGGLAKKILHSFDLAGGDGLSPTGTVVLDSSGNVYGTTGNGGAYGGGTVFELMRTPAGGLKERILYSFKTDGVDGLGPAGGVTLDSAGDLYGTTQAGGVNHGGIIFKLAREENTWTEQVLWNFCSQPQCRDGSSPQTSLVIDAGGNLYGTTPFGDAPNAGVAFELTLQNGVWTERILHSFASEPLGADGETPLAGLVLDGAGNLYGTTSSGGFPGGGAVFEITP